MYLDKATLIAMNAFVILIYDTKQCSEIYNTYNNIVTRLSIAP